jgi:hypothetical protein
MSFTSYTPHLNHQSPQPLILSQPVLPHSSSIDSISPFSAAQGGTALSSVALPPVSTSGATIAENAPSKEIVPVRSVIPCETSSLPFQAADSIVSLSAVPPIHPPSFTPSLMPSYQQNAILSSKDALGPSPPAPVVSVFPSTDVSPLCYPVDPSVFSDPLAGELGRKSFVCGEPSNFADALSETSSISSCLSFNSNISVQTSYSSGSVFSLSSSKSDCSSNSSQVSDATKMSPKSVISRVSLVSISSDDTQASRTVKSSGSKCSSETSRVTNVWS